MKKQTWLGFFAANLRECMDEAEMDVDELSRESKVSKESIYKYLQGVRMPSVPAVVNMAYALDVYVGDLLGEEDFIE